LPLTLLFDLDDTLRADWPGFGVGHEPYDLVTAQGSSHFAHRSTAYYAEILAKMGWPEAGIVMVGNNSRGRLAAEKLGLPTFFIAPNGNAPELAGIPPSPEGSASLRRSSGLLGDVIPWVQSSPPENLLPNYRSPEAIIAILKATIAALDAWLPELTEAQWEARTPGEEWSIRDAVCHLRDVELLVNRPRFEQFEFEANPFMSAADTDSWAKDGAYEGISGLWAFQELIAARRDSLAWLARLDEGQWRLPARHAIFGPTDFLEIMSIMAGHDQLHVRQIRRSLHIQPES